MNIEYNKISNRDTRNILVGLFTLLKHDPTTFFDTEFSYPTLQLCSKISPKDLTKEEFETMFNCDWDYFKYESSGEEYNYWQYDFSKRYRDN